MSESDIATIIREIQKNRADQEIVHARMQSDMQELKEKTEEMYVVFKKGDGFISVLKWLGIMAGVVTAIVIGYKNIR